MSVEDNKVLVRRFYDEVVNADNVAVIDQLVADDVVGHSPDVGAGIGGTRAGINAFVAELLTMRTMLSNFQVSVEQVLGAGDRVAVQGISRGRHTGVVPGIAPTGAEVTITWSAIHRIADGRIVERWLNADDLSSFQQFGLIPRQ